jgi:antitoxin component YwqK of YwqJK toxin-antitoxin module
MQGYAQVEHEAFDTVFLDSKWKKTKYRELAKYYRYSSLNPADSILTVHDYFIKNDQLQMIGTYQGELERNNQTGEFKYFYNSGIVKAIYEYKSGLVDGNLKRFYPNGKLKSIEQYDLGVQVDTIYNFFENGHMHKTEVLNKDYSLGEPSEKYKKTRLVNSFENSGEIQVKNGNGEYTQYYLSGKIRMSIEYKEGLPHGKWIYYSGRKNKASCKMTFKEGKFIKGEIYENGKKDIFSSLSRNAYFPEGIRGLDKFLKENTGECKEDIKDPEILIMVSVTTEGHVYFEQVISGNVSSCQLEEIQMLVKNMPKWVPAIENFKYIEASQALRIEY